MAVQMDVTELNEPETSSDATKNDDQQAGGDVQLPKDVSNNVDAFLALARASADKSDSKDGSKRPNDETLEPRMPSKRARSINTTKTPLQLLHEMFDGLCFIRFVEEGVSGPDHDPIYKMSVHVRGEVFEGEGKTKQGAKQKAAKKAIEFFERHGQRKANDNSSNQIPRPGKNGRYFSQTGPSPVRYGQPSPEEPLPFMPPPHEDWHPMDGPLPPPGPPFGWRPPPPSLTFGRPPMPPDRFGPPRPPFERPPFDRPPFNRPPFMDRMPLHDYWPPPNQMPPLPPLLHPRLRPPPPPNNLYMSFDSPIQPIPLPGQKEPIIPPPLQSRFNPAPRTAKGEFAEDPFDSHDFIEFDKLKEDPNSKATENDEDDERLARGKEAKVVLRVTAEGMEAENLVNEHPVALIHELHSDLQWDFVGTKMTGKVIDSFTMSLTINKKVYKGEGKTKKLARFNAARQALADLYNILIPESVPNPANPEKKQTKNVLTKVDDNQLLHEQLATQIGLAVLEKSKEIFEKLSVTKKWNVLSGIVLTKTNDPSYFNLICVTSGTKCIKGDSMSMNGYCVNDCHAEVLARRCFVKFLFDQISSLTNNGFMNDDSYIIERREDANGFRLKREIKVHLFISSAPCGDSRVFSPKDEDTNTDAHPNRISRGLLRAKIEGGEGTIPVKRETALLTFDGIMQGQQRIQFMSCSDKIAMWNVVGIQGSILSHFIEPIYLESVVLGSLFNYEHLLRGVYGRLNLNFESHSLVDLPDLYRVNKIKIAKAKLPAADVQRQLSKTPSYAVNWIQGDSTPEVISSDVGKTYLDNLISRLSKRTFFQQFRSLLEQNVPTMPSPSSSPSSSPSPSSSLRNDVGQNVPTIPSSSSLHNNIPIIYRDAKTASSEYSRAKIAACMAFEEQNLGHWIQLPAEFDLFSL